MRTVLSDLHYWKLLNREMRIEFKVKFDMTLQDVHNYMYTARSLVVLLYSPENQDFQRSFNPLLQLTECNASSVIAVWRAGLLQ